MCHMWEADNAASKDEKLLHLLSRGKPLHRVRTIDYLLRLELGGGLSVLHPHLAHVHL